MAVYSMTGYASVERSIPRQGTSGEGDGAGEEARLSLEIRSVNSRFLDIAFRLPDDWRAAAETNGKAWAAMRAAYVKR